MATDATSTHLHKIGEQMGLRARAAQSEMPITAAALFVIVLVIYGLTQTHLNTFDAVSYANQIAHRQHNVYPKTNDLHWLFHPHHLLFNATGFILWRLCRVLGYIGGPLAVLQGLNALLGATSVTLFYLTLRRLLQRSQWLPILAAAGLALSFGFWACATDGRVNMASTTLLLAAFFVLCRLLDDPRPRLAALVGGLAGTAVLYHESAGLFLLVGLAGVLMAAPQPYSLPQARRLQRRTLLLAYLGAWFAVVLVPYLLVGTVGLGLYSLGAFRHWMSAYSELGWWWNFQIPHNIRLDAYALRHAAFVEPPGKQGTFHISRTTPVPLLALYFAALAGWFVAAYAFCAALPLLWRSHQRRVLIVCLLWIGLYAAFFTVWSPGYFVFWVPVMIGISVLLALALAHYRARYGLVVNWVFGIWIGLFAALNVQASIAPHHQPDASPFRQMTADIRAHTRPGDLILVAGAGDTAPLEVEIPYFADRDVLSLHTLLTRQREDKDAALLQARAQIADTLQSGHAVYALDELWNRRTLDALHAKHPEWSRDDLTALCLRQREAWEGPRGRVWQVALPMAAGAPEQSIPQG